MFREAETDCLQFVIAKTKRYAAMVAVLVTALQHAGTRQVLDLCSGAGGSWQWLRPALAATGTTFLRAHFRSTTLDEGGFANTGLFSKALPRSSARSAAVA